MTNRFMQTKYSNQTNEKYEAISECILKSVHFVQVIARVVLSIENNLLVSLLPWLTLTKTILYSKEFGFCSCAACGCAKSSFESVRGTGHQSEGHLRLTMNCSCYSV